MSQPNENKSEGLTFEAAIDQLQQVVKRLESGDTPLEESLRLFEEGVRLTRHCQERLKAAEQRIEILIKAPAPGNDGSPELQPFDPQKRS